MAGRSPTNDGVPPILELDLGSSRLRLRYLAEGPRLYVLASTADPEWASQVLRVGRARVLVGGRTVEGPARLVSDATARAELLRRFVSESPDGRGSEWYSAPGPLVELLPSAAPVADPYGAWLESTFDAAAAEYRARIDANPVEHRFRERSMELLQSTFPRPSRLLELGSGPGVETLPMLQLGHEVWAVDVSPKMLGALEEEAELRGVRQSLTTRVGRLRDLAELTAAAPPASFDGAYSTFGALNLEPDLAPTVRVLARVVRPGGRVVAGTFNRWAVGEVAALGLAGRFRAIGRRRGRPAPTGAHRFPVDVYYRSRSELDGAFATAFRRSHSEAAGLALPPPNLSARFDGIGIRWEALEALDRSLGHRELLGGWADQRFAVYDRVEPSGPPVPGGATGNR